MVTGKQVSRSGIFSIDGERVLIDGSSSNRFEIHLVGQDGSGINGIVATATKKEIEEILKNGELTINISKGRKKKNKVLKLSERNKKQIRAQLHI